MIRHINRLPQDHSGGKYLIFTLGEVKAQVDSTAGRDCPTVKELRQYGRPLVRKAMDECLLEVYKSGFAICQTAYAATVLRLDQLGSVDDNKDWCIPLMREGQRRVAAGVVDPGSVAADITLVCMGDAAAWGLGHYG